MQTTQEEEILLIALIAVTDKLDAFIGACMDENGNPIAPSRQELARVRGTLPKRCVNAFKGKE